jgi:hypothetical protein
MRAPADPSASLALAPPVGQPTPPSNAETQDDTAVAACDYCGSGRLEWRKCKLICADCRQINKSCADL